MCVSGHYMFLECLAERITFREFSTLQKSKTEKCVNAHSLIFEISNFRPGAILEFSDAQSSAKNPKIALNANNAILEAC